MNDIQAYNEPVVSNANRIMEERGVKKGFIADKMGLNGQIWSDITAGRRIIKISEVVALRAALGVDINELFSVHE